MILLAEQEAGTLDSWQQYRRQNTVMPDSENYVAILNIYQDFLSNTGLISKTIRQYSASARQLLIYIENHGITKVSDIKHQNIADYFGASKFENRKLKGIQSEVCRLRKFLNFLDENGHNDSKTLKYSLPYHRISVQRIITILTPEIISDVMKDKSNSIINFRDKAMCLLALHIGLRGSNICNLKLGDIDWEKGILNIIQSKTNVELQMPLDSETQNAIIYDFKNAWTHKYERSSALSID